MLSVVFLHFKLYREKFTVLYYSQSSFDYTVSRPKEINVERFQAGFLNALILREADKRSPSMRIPIRINLQPPYKLQITLAHVTASLFLSRRHARIRPPDSQTAS